MPLRRALLMLLLALPALACAQDATWPTYGGDPGGQRFSPAAQIDRANVTSLQPAWTFHTHALSALKTGSHNASFEDTPILFRGLLYVTTPFDQVFALDPASGLEQWSFAPHLRKNTDQAIVTSRGVAAWASATQPADQPCATRLFLATLDHRLLAIDARTGVRCTGFGSAGEVDLAAGVPQHEDTAYFNSSPPTVVGDVVVVGSGIGDNTRVDAPSGVVRAFDATTGRMLWSWDPIPWAQQQRLPTGAANAWSVIAADPEHHLVFIPTGAPSPDFYGGLRPDDNRDANSVVALDAATGRRVWGFQVVHHDLWDYDVAAEPLLFTFRGRDGQANTSAIAIATKQGLVFVLNRLTGEPLWPVHERAVPASDVPGEQASPTQPFPDLPPLSPLTLPADAQLGADAQDNRECRQIFAQLRYEGIYTPPSLRGTLAFPGNLGGVNWGGAALDPATGILYANTNRYAFSIQFHPRGPARSRWRDKLTDTPALAIESAVAAALLLYGIAALRRRSLHPGRGVLWTLASLAATLAAALTLLAVLPPLASDQQVEHFGHEHGEQLGTPYVVERNQLIAPTSHHPCTPEPWGAVSALNLNTGQPAWQTPLGTLIPGQHTGTVNLGGDLVTAGGLVFTAASENPVLRAYNSATGAELWQGQLPVPAQATPMTYTVHGRQFIVIAAGGHGLFGTKTADAVVAFALPGSH